MKKVLTIQDISCVGGCSLTVALPIISAMGIETCILPTAILSTHTGGFHNFTFHDLSNEFPKIINHWKNENICFDGLYTGYIGSNIQIEYIKDLISLLQLNNEIICVDPAMADHGKLYPGFDSSYVESMKSLCQMADYLVPNLTEACLLANQAYLEKYTKKDIESLLLTLSNTYAKKVLITGISFDEKYLGAAMYDQEANKFSYYFNDYVPYEFHGTGDIFASVFFGSIINGNSMEDACKEAVDFTLESIRETIDDASSHWYGVHFESALPMLLKNNK